MFLIKIISKNNIVDLTLYFFLLMFIFYSLGRIVQNKISFKKTNTSLAIPFGFIFYLFITQIFYTPIIFFQFETNVISFIEDIKEILLFILIASYFKDWMPRSFLTIADVRSIGLKLVSFSILISVFFLMESYVAWFMPLTRDGVTISGNNFMESISKLSDGKTQIFNTHHNTMVSGFEKYETTYYWMANLSFKTKINSEFIIDIFIPLISCIIIIFIVQSFIIDNERSIITHILSFIISFIFLFMIGLIGAENQIFLPFVVEIFISFLLLSFSLRESPNNNMIVVSLFLLCLLSTMTYLSVFIIIILGSLITIVSLDKKGNYVYNVLLFVLILFSSLMAFTFLIFLDELAFSKLLYYMSIMGVFSMFFIVPIYSLWNSEERKKEQIDFEKKINNHLFKYVSIISFAFIFFIFLVAKIHINYFIDPNWKGFFKVISDKLWLAEIIWFFIIIIPSIIFLLFGKYIPKSSFLVSLGFINLLFINPVTLMFLLSIFHFDLSVFYIFAPTVLFIILWVIGIFISSIPEKLRL